MTSKRFANHKPRGQVLIVVTFALVAILGMAGLAIDGGNTFLDRRNAQNAADSAALAGAIIRVNTPGGDWVGAILASAAENGYDNDGATNTVEVFSPPREGPYSNNIEYVEVVITSRVRTYFARIVGRSENVNIVTAVIRTKPAVLKPLLGENAIVSLAPTSECGKDKAFRVYEEATFEVSGGGVFINSNNKNCALIQEASGSIYMRYKDPILIVGGVSIHNPRRISPVIKVGASQISYPPPFLMPEIDCKQSAQINEDLTSMSPGSWSGKFPPVGVTQLYKGVYCLENGFTANKNTHLFGDDVVIVMDDGDFVINGEADIQISAPSEGKYQGLLIFVPMENKSRVVLNGGVSSEFSGTILAPSSNILVKGNESKRGFHSQIIGYNIALSGDNNVVVVYDPKENYKALTMPELQLIR